MHGLISQPGAPPRRSRWSRCSTRTSTRRTAGGRCATSAATSSCVPNPIGRDGVGQADAPAPLPGVGSEASSTTASWSRRLQDELDRVLQGQRFDLVNLELPYLAHFRLRQSPPGTSPPPLVLDAHEIAYDIVRQVARGDGSPGRRLYAALNWRKLRRDERAAFRSVDGVSVCSVADQERLLEHAPLTRTVVIPNAADVELLPAPPGRSTLGRPHRASSSASSPPSPTSTGCSSSCGRSGRASRRSGRKPAARSSAPGPPPRCAGMPGRGWRSPASSKTCGPTSPPRRRSSFRCAWAAGRGSRSSRAWPWEGPSSPRPSAPRASRRSPRDLLIADEPSDVRRPRWCASWTTPPWPTGSDAPRGGWRWSAIPGARRR